jgi:hypothetical protein
LKLKYPCLAFIVGQRQIFFANDSGSDVQPLKAPKNHSVRVSRRPLGRGSATKEQPLGNYFEVRFRTEKYVETYFSAESEAKQSDPRKEAASARAASSSRRVDDLNVQVIRSYS